MKTNKELQFICHAHTGQFSHYTGQKLSRFDSLATIPKGTATNNNTAMGKDENYNFICDFSKIDKCFHHDLTYHGANVPKEFLTE